jgi:hypothetical protein
MAGNDNSGLWGCFGRVVALLVLCAAGYGIYQAFHYQSPAERKTRREIAGVPQKQRGGPYYRVKVNLTYKGTPQNFDFVVACSATITRRVDGTTYEVGLTPTLFGRRMADGKGLVIRPPTKCRGETTENGKVPKNLLPMVVVYDDADTLAFGTAYVSKDAYTNPLSVLEFKGATISSATAEEFEESHERGEKNLVTREQYHSYTMDPDRMWKEMGLKLTEYRMGIGCLTYSRLEIPEKNREAVRAGWPSHHPKYWKPEGNPFRNFGIRSLDLNRKSPLEGNVGGGARYSDVFYPPFYPVRTIDAEFPRKLSDEELQAKLAQRPTPPGMIIDFKGGRSVGFAYCYSTSHTFGPVVKIRFGEVEGYPSMPVVTDEQDKPVLIDSISPHKIGHAPTFIIENDEYIFIVAGFGLGSTRGDI